MNNSENTLLNRIRQTFINLEQNTTESEISKSLQKSFRLLDSELDLQSAQELFNLILYCFSHNHNQPPAIFNEILHKSRINSNYIIITASILYQLNQKNSNEQHSNFQSFIKESFNQIFTQINKSDTLIIFNKVIPNQFKTNFIIDIILLAELKQDQISDLYQFIISYKSLLPISKICEFIQKLYDNDLMSTIPDQILTDDTLSKFFTIDFLSLIIPNMSENAFKQILQKIEEKKIDLSLKDWTRSFSKLLLNKIIEYNININFFLINKILDNILPCDLKKTVWKYLSDRNITIPLNLASKISKFPDPVSALKIMPQKKMIPKDVYDSAMLLLPDLYNYTNLLNSESFVKSKIYSTPGFWSHLVSIASNSICYFYDSFDHLFKEFVDKEEMLNVINEMIFKNYPTTKNANAFLVDLFENNDDFHSVRIMNSLFSKTLEQKVLPDLSFWNLFDFKYIDQYEKLKNSDPYVLCAYLFSKENSNFYEFKSIEIKPQKNKKTIKQIIDFIKNDDLRKINELNEEVLSFVICSLIFLSCKNKPEVKGLNEDLILPFYAIGFVYNSSIQYETTFCDAPELSQMLLNECKKLSKKQSLLSTTSIDVILSNIWLFLDPSFFPHKTAIQILDTLYTILINGLYKADKFELLKSFFILVNCADHDDEVKNLLTKHTIKIFKYIIHNLNQISNIRNLMQFRIILSVFESDEIKKFFIEIIENSTSTNKLINTIDFIENYCQNVPDLLITYPTNLIHALKVVIEKEEWDNLYLIGNFMKNNNLSIDLSDSDIKPIPFEIKKFLFGTVSIELNELISAALKEENPENQYLIFECIFKKLMKDKSISINYLIYSLERIGHNYSIKPSDVLKYFQNEYNEYGDLFVKAFSIAYSYHATSGMFARNPVFRMPPLSKSSISLVSNLLSKADNENANFQVFYCLYEIASSFPFLFVKNAQQVFVLAFSNFDNSLVEYLATQKGNINEFKKSLYSFLFLIKCLFSIKILNEFIPWCVININNFNDSQIFIFVFILEFLFRIKSVYKVMYSLVINFNLLNVLADFLNKKINENLSFSLKKSIYNIVMILISVVQTQSANKLIYLDELSHLDDQFIISFDNFNSIFFQYWESIQNIEEKTAIHTITNLFNSLSSSKKYFLSFKNYSQMKEPKLLDVDNFVIYFTEYFQPNLNYSNTNPIELPDLSYFFITGCIRYLATQRKFVYLFIIKDRKLPLLPKHASILRKAIDDLNQFKHRIGDDANYFSSYIYEFLSKPICNKKMFKMIVKEAMNGNDKYPEIMSIINKISNEKKILICFLKQLNSFLLNEKNNNIDVVRLLEILDEISNSEEFDEFFIKYCGYNFVDICLLPENRNNSNIINLATEILLSSNSSLPSNVNYLICFLLIKKRTDLMNTALNLCEKVGDNNLSNVMSTIQSVFDYVFKETKDTAMIQSFLSTIPSLGKHREKNVIGFLNVLIKNYLRGHNSFELCESICIILNSLAPNKNFNLLENIGEEIQSHSSGSIDEVNSNIDDFIIGQPTSKMIESDQNFWKLYKTHRIIINGIIVNHESLLTKMKFLFNFPGLLSFKIRMNYFKEKTKNITNELKGIDLYIHRQNIFSESFDLLHQLSPYEIRRTLDIKFLGEDGVDLGGLTNEWFTLIIQEIFKESNKLFVRTDKNNYQPNPLSYEIENHLELFKFSGMIIARAILQNQYINAHFTRSFYKQILGFPINFTDLEDFDEDLFNSLNYYLDNDVEPLGLNFTINVSRNGKIETILLKEKGDEIDITNKNKKEFVKLYAYYHLKAAIKNQINAFREGFNSIIPFEKFVYFSPTEFDLLICGIPVIDVNDLRANTVYDEPYYKDHPTIKLFFDTISKWNNDNLANLLLFITGSPQVPINGFIEYKNKGKPIKIMPGGDNNRFCVAHTCFNILALPSYKTEDEMNKKLLISIQQTEFCLI